MTEAERDADDRMLANAIKAVEELSLDNLAKLLGHFPFVTSKEDKSVEREFAMAVADELGVARTQEIYRFIVQATRLTR
jgi:hypothetical protein